MADAADSKSADRKVVKVRLLSPAPSGPFKIKRNVLLGCYRPRFKDGTWGTRPRYGGRISGR